MSSITPTQIAADLTLVRSKKPLVHHITNFVVMNETANMTLCTGGLPIMSHAKEEVAEMVQMANCLLLNIGTLTPEWIEAMLLAGKQANRSGIPIVLDPVGAGATKLRTDSSHRLMEELTIAIVRGNLAEISILAGHKAEIRGVESISAKSEKEIVATELAEKYQCIVAITGAQDVVSNGKNIAYIDNGHPMLTTVTGTGCMATTVIACCAGVQKDYFRAAVSGLCIYGIAAELAAQQTDGKPGSFHTALYDAMKQLTDQDVIKFAKVK
ncbi:MAG: hydroxyethylthiazole kinase [bacterium]|nr:hydroxyethylthiazole kinase [bacterium]